MRLTQAQRQPNMTFSIGVRRLEEFDEQALVAGFTIPLGHRGAPTPSLPRRERSASSCTLAERSRQLDLTATLFALYQEVLHARTEAEALRNAIRPQAERMLSTIEDGLSRRPILLARARRCATSGSRNRAGRDPRCRRIPHQSHRDRAHHRRTRAHVRHEVIS